MIDPALRIQEITKGLVRVDELVNHNGDQAA